MLTSRVNLRFPIQLPGGEVTFVTARPIVGQDYQVMHEGGEGAWRAMANAVRLPVDVLMRLDTSDFRRIVDAIADLSFDAAVQINSMRRPALALVVGGGQ